MQKSVIRLQKTNEWLEFISRLGLVSIEDARNVFLSGDYSQISDLDQKALFAAGRGKTLSLEGNLIGSKLTLDEAQLFAETSNAERGFPVKDEVLAYINYERGVFFEKFGEYHSGLSLYRSAKRLAESLTLHSVIDYQMAAHLLQVGAGSSIEEARYWIQFFREHKMQIMHLIAIRRLAKYHRVEKDYPKALDLLASGRDFAVKFDYPFMVEQIRNSYGYLLYSMGEIKEARKVFLELMEGVQSRYLYATVLKNLTLTYYDEAEYDAAVQYLGQAIEHSQKYEILSQIPDECLFMGDLQRDKLQHPEVATHYYEIGSQVAIKMAEHGFSLKGDRRGVVHRFQERSKVGYSIPDSIGPRANPFSFALGQSWKQINDAFQFHLIQKHLDSGIVISELPGKLDLKTSTYYAIKRRLSQHGYDFDGTSEGLPIKLQSDETSALNAYISGLTDLTWSLANEQFEKEIIEYLFKQVGYQKTKLAEKLDISYPTVLQKTKSLKMA
ncbi:MAG: tetratricopeptide repeat protein [FCB group bacterium]|nr:tetratricopeptide repeat protein [FCB group bacterium]MBL7029465.1 tetratricopeptide repeat protein [Candidatus Neomarinimicrobiota bacterium]MBL7123086.1 tetratricopeptide repeat protein [Candidatus Neomarinimicrobiota bacterium]